MVNNDLAAPRIVVIIDTFTDLILRVILAAILKCFMGVNGIWTSWPIAWTIATVMSFVFYKSGIWSRRLKIRNT